MSTSACQLHTQFRSGLRFNTFFNSFFSQHAHSMSNLKNTGDVQGFSLHIQSIPNFNSVFQLFSAHPRFPHPPIRQHSSIPRIQQQHYYGSWTQTQLQQQQEVIKGKHRHKSLPRQVSLRGLQKRCRRQLYICVHDHRLHTNKYV